MNGYNRIIIIGNVGGNPDTRTTKTGKTVVKFDVCVNERRKVDGENSDSSEWFKVVAFGSHAEYIVGAIKKGRRVFVEGRVQTSSWQGKDGATRHEKEVVSHNIIPLDGTKSPEQPNDAPEAPDDDMPF
jgi:single-strand DNA-binding protein